MEKFLLETLYQAFSISAYTLFEWRAHSSNSLRLKHFGTSNSSLNSTSSLCPTASSRTYTWGLLPSEALIAHPMKKYYANTFRVEIFLLELFLIIIRLRILNAFSSRDLSPRTLPRTASAAITCLDAALRRKGKTQGSDRLGLATLQRCSAGNCSVPTGAKKILTDALGTIHTLVLDSVRPPRPESSNASLFRIRARGLEFDVDQCCFAQEQLTGPDPSVAPGSLIDYPYD